MKENQFNHAPEKLNIEAKVGMLNTVQEQLVDYLKYTDADVKGVTKEMHKSYNKII